MDELVVSSPAASSLVKVTVIYQIGPVYLHAVSFLLPTYVTIHNPHKTRALQLSTQVHIYG